MLTTPDLLAELNDRSREVFRRVVEGYLETGEPVGSRTLSRTLNEKVSAATIRNTMQDLEKLGILDSPHISAGRIPTQLGLRLFVDSLMEVDPVAPTDRARIRETVGEGATDVEGLMDRVGAALSLITHGASLVLTPKREAPVRHIEFVSLSPDRALVVLVYADGHVENRLFSPPLGQTPSSMREAGNYLNAHASGRTLSELRDAITADIDNDRQQLDSLASDLVAAGLALWDQPDSSDARLIVRGRANLIGPEAADLDRVRTLFDDLERKRDIAEFLELTEQGQGVRIFIGSENKLFSLSGSSLVVSPYMNADHRIVGAVGVIGPTRLNYGRIVPIVDYTAQLVGRILSGQSTGQGR
ncbi:heat-inducible transcriptional repressor HrcA [Paracoccus pacificus]|uniref:Heat-inducible transcription repressor HrcA n=1 Tax=Paracoccus pacificus TaxID=1463598 RepID=A0ABW4R2S2_9RHOB